MRTLRKIWKSWTVWASGLVMAAGSADVLGAVDMKAVLALAGVPPEKIGGAFALMGLVFFLLRLKTTKPVSAK